MGLVIERVFDQNGYFEDVPSTYEQADAIAGRRTDRRRNLAIIEGKVHGVCAWSCPCSGCSDAGHVPMHGRGNGCEECGYTGRRRHAQWLDLDLIEDTEDA